MSRVTTYLNFDGTAEEALTFYAAVFGTSIEGQIFRVGDMPPPPGTPELSDDEKRRVGHAQLPILAGRCRRRVAFSTFVETYRKSSCEVSPLPSTSAAPAKPSRRK